MYGSCGSFGSYSSMFTPFSTLASAQPASHSSVCAYSLWPRRASLSQLYSSDDSADDDYVHPTSYLSDEDLCPPSPSPSPPPSSPPAPFSAPGRPFGTASVGIDIPLARSGCSSASNSSVLSHAGHDTLDFPAPRPTRNFFDLDTQRARLHLAAEPGPDHVALAQARRRQQQQYMQQQAQAQAASRRRRPAPPSAAFLARRSSSGRSRPAGMTPIVEASE